MPWVLLFYTNVLTTAECYNFTDFVQVNYEKKYRLAGIIGGAFS